VARYADMLSAMGTEPRLRIMRLLLSAYPGGIVVGEIGDELGMPGPTLSHHLEKLKKRRSRKRETRRHVPPVLGQRRGAAATIGLSLRGMLLAQARPSSPPQLSGSPPGQTRPAARLERTEDHVGHQRRRQGEVRQCRPHGLARRKSDLGRPERVLLFINVWRGRSNHGEFIRPEADRGASRRSVAGLARLREPDRARSARAGRGRPRPRVWRRHRRALVSQAGRSDGQGLRTGHDG